MFDVIVVGGGTAGCVLAERLSRSGRRRVLLLEAGGPPTSRFVAIPAAFTKLFKGEHDWDFETEPQAACRGRRVFTPRGKMLGGSANMNAMMHQWCHPADFDGWAAAGATGWSWDEVVPTFRAQERWGGDGGDALRGREGPMRIEPNRNARPLTRDFVVAARAAGLPADPDYNGRAYSGAWIAELAHRDGKRFSAYHAFLQPAMQRANLEVVGAAHATGIVIEAGRATGVSYRQDGVERNASAGAVVLAAGTYGSAQLLQLSGIGPPAALREFDLPVRVDAPEVGRNLQDHPVVPLVYATSNRDTMLRAESLPQLLSYLLFKRGMLASNGVEGFAFCRLGTHGAAAPDAEIMFLPFEARRDFLQAPQLQAFSIGPAVVAPRARGTLTLRGKDPLLAPRIDPNLLGDPEGIDAAVMLAGVRLARKIAATAPLVRHSLGEIRPGAAVTSDSELLDFVAGALQTVYHPTSTCRMGNDRGSVVDPRLKVRGLDGLWIADASVMPSVPRGHPNAVVAMIANRAAEWIEAGIPA